MQAYHIHPQVYRFMINCSCILNCNTASIYLSSLWKLDTLKFSTILTYIVDQIQMNLYEYWLATSILKFYEILKHLVFLHFDWSNLSNPYTFSLHVLRCLPSCWLAILVIIQNLYGFIATSLWLNWLAIIMIYKIHAKLIQSTRILTGRFVNNCRSAWWIVTLTHMYWQANV